MGVCKALGYPVDVPEPVIFRGLDGVKRNANKLAKCLDGLLIPTYYVVRALSSCVVIFVYGYIAAFRPGNGIGDLGEAKVTAIQPLFQHP